MNEEDLATFYWNLYSALKERGFDESQAMTIILRTNPKIPENKGDPRAMIKKRMEERESKK